MQRYDTVHSTRAGWAYREFQQDLDDWQLNEQCCAVLAPFADWTQHMQGTVGFTTFTTWPFWLCVPRRAPDFTTFTTLLCGW